MYMESPYYLSKPKPYFLLHSDPIWQAHAEEFSEKHQERLKTLEHLQDQVPKRWLDSLKEVSES